MKIAHVLLLAINKETVNTQQAKRLTSVFAIFELSIINYICPPTHKHCFQFPFGRLESPKRVKNNAAYAANKVYYGQFENTEIYRISFGFGTVLPEFKYKRYMIR